MRSRKRRKSRSSLSQDIHKVYTGGFGACVVEPIDLPLANEQDFDVEFCQHILARDPNHAEALALLGEAYAKRGEYAKGLDADLRLSRLSPENDVVQYNLACSYALNGQKEDALEALVRAVELGYRDLDHLRNDRDLAILKSEPRYSALLERLAAEQYGAGLL